MSVLRVAAAPVAIVSFLTMLALMVGCEPTTRTSDPPQVSITDLPSEEELGEQLDDVLDFTYEIRHLTLQDHAAWQILHGALAYKRNFLVDKPDGTRVSAVDHILSGGRVRGFDTEIGSQLDPDKDEYGLRILMDPGSKAGQGHHDQWLAVLAQSELPPDQTIRASGQDFTMADIVRQVQFDMPRNTDREYSWTLIGLTSYLPTDTRWTAFDGGTWSIEGLVESEALHPLGDGACGGSHRLIGLCMALNRHLAQGGKIEGPWKQAEQRIQQGIQKAREFQNPDGSFSTNYFARPGRSPDLAQNLGTTGHTLEFLTLACTDEQLKEPWVERAVLNLCDLFRKTKSIPLECGALYHATHGLMLYRHRVYGEEFLPSSLAKSAE
ncbi:MAG: ADP-ribosylation factor-directed GTPase activating protein isoform b [Pirellulaceae bacterium]